MPSPVVDTDIPDYNAQAAVCDKLELLLRTSDRLKDLLGYMFDAAGNVADGFATDIAAAIGSIIGVPVGTVIWRPVSAVPAGYVIANGQSLSKTTYADLFAVYGTNFGSDSSITFKVPNMYDKFQVGGGSTYSIGSNFGSSTATLIEANLPAHSHEFTVEANNVDGSGSGVLTGGSDNAVSPRPDGTFTGTTEETGSGAPFSIIPSCVAGLWLVKT